MQSSGFRLPPQKNVRSTTGVGATRSETPKKFATHQPEASVELPIHFRESPNASTLTGKTRWREYLPDSRAGAVEECRARLLSDVVERPVSSSASRVCQRKLNRIGSRRRAGDGASRSFGLRDSRRRTQRRWKLRRRVCFRSRRKGLAGHQCHCLATPKF
jgi:hypothetical protein